MLLLTGSDVHDLLQGREDDVIAAVESAYLAHEAGRSHLPACEFLRFPDKDKERVIPLPAYLGAPFDVAGIKWIASFPDNVERGMERASASMILNSTETGRPQALVEASIISAKRTAGSAALAARHLHTPPESGEAAERASFVGCGLISFQTGLFLTAAFPELREITLYDLDPSRARQLADHLQAATDRTLEFNIADSSDDALAAAPLVVFATTAVDPHVSSLEACPPGSTILHISLRDLAPDVILRADNVVDDVDHVCQAETSVHRAEQQTGDREFIRGTLAQVVEGEAPPRPDDERPTVFSPFGLGVLDLAVAHLTCSAAREQGRGRTIEDFIPPAWTERTEAVASPNRSSN
jgi:ornithine cyclodeaminase